MLIAYVVLKQKWKCLRLEFGKVDVRHVHKWKLSHPAALWGPELQDSSEGFIHHEAANTCTKKPATHQTFFMCRNVSAGWLFERTASMKILELWYALDNTQTCVADGYKHVRRRCGLGEMTGRLWLPCMLEIFREHQALGAQVISHSLFSFCPSAHLSPPLDVSGQCHPQQQHIQ